MSAVRGLRGKVEEALSSAAVNREKEKDMAKEERVLISFIHPVGIWADGRAVMVHCCVCRDVIGSGEAEVTGKQSPSKAIARIRSTPSDFPLTLEVLSLADGKDLEMPNKLIVKWNNVSGIVSLGAK